VTVAYAAVADMTARYGVVEMRRVSVADGDVPETVLPARIERTLIDVSSLVDGYLSTRYRLPLDPVPDAIRRAVCVIARHDLWQGGERSPAEEMRKDRDAEIAWLGRLASGAVRLDGAAPAGGAGLGANARAADRQRLGLGVIP
jgi:phage gp36-like protein